MTERALIESHDKRRIYDRQNGLCAYCGQHRNIKYMTVDHIIPLSKGGTDEIDNLQCTCKKCNKLKSDMPWVQKCHLGFFFRGKSGCCVL